MYKEKTVGIVVPAYNEEKLIGRTLGTIPDFVDRIIIVDDCSTDLDLRGLPVFRGLIGPMPDGENIIRYESPEVFETLTKDWGAVPPPRRSRSRVRAPR